MTTTETAEATFVLLDPKTVAPNPRNARKKLREIDALARSAKAVGILEPVVVVPNGTGETYTLIAGHRRRAAAEKAGVPLPAIVRPDLAGLDVDQARALLTENEQRDDLSTAERARAYQAALDLGMSPDELATTTGRELEEVAAVVRVAESPVATGLAERHDLTLEEAAVFAEFDGDKEALKVLTKTAVQHPENWDWQVRMLRRERDDRIRVEKELAPYREDGTRILSDDEERSGKVVAIANLLTDKGKNLTPATHRKCPGRAVAVMYGERVVEVCVDPKANGHVDRFSAPGKRAASTTGKSDKAVEAQREKEKAERRELVAHNKAFAAATDVRVEYVRKLLARRSVPAGTARFATAQIVTSYFRVEAPVDKLCELAGIDNPGSGGFELPLDENGKTPIDRWLDSLPENRVVMGLLAYVAAAIESQTARDSWRHVDDRRAAWFSYLASTGYSLSEIEQRVVADVEQLRTKKAAGSKGRRS